MGRTRIVADSWRRSAEARPDVDGPAALRYASDELRAYRAGHPLAPVLPVVSDLLGRAAGDGHLFAVTDAQGVLMWVRGDRATVRRAEKINFVEGAGWAEVQMGTNAPGTALALGQPVQIRAAEHYNPAVRPWSCAAAPVRDPASGAVLGVLDLTGGPEVGHPQALALVRATVRAVEAELARERLLAPVPAQLTALGRDPAELRIDGRTIRLRPRHSEILILLALAGEGGLSGGRLAVELADDELAPVTLRAEMFRLRTVLGPEVLAAQPYRLLRPLRSDFQAVRDLLTAGQVSAACAAYTGPLLPASRAPAVVDARTRLARHVRSAVLAGGDVDALRHWVGTGWGAGDPGAWRRLADLLPGGSGSRAAAAARARELRVG